jgi:hypothetical protein
MMVPFDTFAVAALLPVLVIGAMRLFYGAWPWEASKRWYRTRQAVDLVRDAVDTDRLRLVLRAVEASSDSFDRTLIYENSPEVISPPEDPAVAEEVAASLQKSTKKLPIVRRWLKPSQRNRQIQVAETALLTTGDSEVKIQRR